MLNQRLLKWPLALVPWHNQYGLMRQSNSEQPYLNREWDTSLMPDRLSNLPCLSNLTCFGFCISQQF